MKKEKKTHHFDSMKVYMIRVAASLGILAIALGKSESSILQFMSFLYMLYAFLKPAIDSAIINKKSKPKNRNWNNNYPSGFDESYYNRREEAHEKMKLWNQWDLDEKYIREWNEKRNNQKNQEKRDIYDH